MLAKRMLVRAHADDVTLCYKQQVSITGCTNDVQQYWHGGVQLFMSENVKILCLGPNKAVGLYKKGCLKKENKAE